MVFLRKTTIYLFIYSLLPVAIDLPVTTALYSHPQEPERAGYTLNELLILSKEIYLNLLLVDDYILICLQVVVKIFSKGFWL